MKGDRKPYKLRDDYRKTVKGEETIILKGTVVYAIQEQIHHVRGTHKVQIQFEDKLIWLKHDQLGILR